MVECLPNVAERAAMIDAAAQKVAELFDVLQVGHAFDPNTRDTPRRVARMLIDELMAGRYSEPPLLTEFENTQAFDQMILVGPIDVRSTCAHHLLPIYGHAFIGVVPAADGKLMGLSKYDRIVNYFSARLQIQEELVRQIGEFIMERSGARGVAVRINAVHMCRTQRGVRAGRNGRMVTTLHFGALADDRLLRDEFLRECLSLQAACDD
jgi:GTP cyclohydrolase I